MEITSVLCPHCKKAVYIEAGTAFFCVHCGKQFCLNTQQALYGLDQLIRRGYDALGFNDDEARSIFTQVLDVDSMRFEALIGIVFAFINQLDCAAESANVTAIGFYRLTRRRSNAKWKLRDEDKAEAEVFIDHLDAAIQCAPEGTREKLLPLRGYYADDAYQKMLRMLN